MTAIDLPRSLSDQPRGPRRLGAVELARRLGQKHPPTPEQVLAVEAPTEPLVVVAGAGSGKTQTMAMRVVWLVANGLVEPHRVLGLTFTRKAAAELGARVRQMLRGLSAAHDVEPFLLPDVAAALRTGEPTVSTYHAYAAALLGEHALRIGVEPTSRLIGPAVAWQYAMEAVESYDGDMGDVGYAVSTVVDSVLALAGDLAEHLRQPDELRELLSATCEQVGRLPAELAARRRRCRTSSSVSARGASCCRWSSGSSRSSESAE
jgi:DNA helicase-2/ATP-dependent DNA helicase PcrA